MWTCWAIQVVADEKDPLPQKIELGDNALPGVVKGLVVGEDMSWVVVDIPVGLDERAKSSRKIPTTSISNNYYKTDLFYSADKTTLSISNDNLVSPIVITIHCCKIVYDGSICVGNK